MIKKNILILHPTDVGACSYYRMRWPADLINAKYPEAVYVFVTPFEVEDEYILQRTASIVVSRPFFDVGRDLVQRYLRKRKKYGYMVFADYDDLLFDVGGHSAMTPYNRFPIDSAKSRDLIGSFVGELDGVSVSTEFLKCCFRAEFGVDNVHILPNAVPRNLFGRNARKSIGKDIRKPRVLFGGALACHFKEGHDGDFSGPWIPWLKEAVEKDEIEFHAFGDEENVPHVFMDFIEKVHVHKTISTPEFPSVVASIKPDIYIAPLQENLFNSAKSNLKLLEATAVGAAVVPSIWKYSPYMEAHAFTAVTRDTDAKALRYKVRELCKAPLFSEVLELQNKVMDFMGYWMDSDHYLMRYLKTYFGEALRTNR